MNRQKSVGKFKYFYDEYYTESQPASKPTTHRDLVVENKNVRLILYLLLLNFKMNFIFIHKFAS